MLDRLELELLAREAWRALGDAVDAGAEPAHLRRLTRFAQDADAALERERPELLLARRLHVAAGAGLNANGTQLRRPGGQPREVVRGRPARVLGGGR